MYIPSYEDAVEAWQHEVGGLEILPTGCLVRPSRVPRPTAPCGDRRVRLNRIGFIAAGGTFPPGTYLLRHTCDDDRCVQPTHLVPGTDTDNARDRRDRGRGNVGWKNGRCGPRGHDITQPQNVYLVKQYKTDVRGRRCAECVRERARRAAPQRAERRRERRRSQDEPSP